MTEPVCRRCHIAVDEWSLGRSFAFWFLGGGTIILLGALTLPIGIGVVILPFGVVMVFASPVTMFVTKGVRRCPTCKKSWMPRSDAKWAR